MDILLIYLCFYFLSVLNLDIFSILNAYGASALCNLQLQQFSFPFYSNLAYINSCHIEYVHLLLCAVLIYMYIFSYVLDVDCLLAYLLEETT